MKVPKEVIRQAKHRINYIDRWDLESIEKELIKNREHILLLLQHRKLIAEDLRLFREERNEIREWLESIGELPADNDVMLINIDDIDKPES